MGRTRGEARPLIAPLCAVLIVAALLVFLRAHSFYAYQKARAEAKSLEASFPQLEADLRAAARFPGHPAALAELGRICLERAFAEIQFGEAEKREAFLDRARDALAGQIRANPLDANSYYRLGVVYTLFSYPLKTYADRGWPYIVRALELSPCDEFLNVNGLYLLLAQWDGLSEGVRAFVWARLGDIAASNPGFLSKIGAQWATNFGSADGLRGILSRNAELWPRIQGLL